MAEVLEVTVSTVSTVRIGDQERQVGLALIWRLQAEDTDVAQVVRNKARELEKLHLDAWKGVRDEVLASTRPAQTPQVPAGPDGADDGAMSADAPGQEEPEPPLPTQIKALGALARASGTGEEEFQTMLRKQFGCSQIEELSRKQAGSLLIEMQRCQRDLLARQKSRRRNDRAMT